MEYSCRACGAMMITSEEVKTHRQDFPSHGLEIVGQCTPCESIIEEPSTEKEPYKTDEKLL